MTGLMAAVVALAALQGGGDSELAAYRRQIAMERAGWERGRACVSDSTRLFQQAGRDAARAAEAWVDRFHLEGDARRLSFDACQAGLSGQPARYTPPPMPPAAQRAASRPAPRDPPFSDGPFSEFTWVFYADIALGLVLGALAALINTGAQTTGWRITLTAGAAFAGGTVGAVVFIPFMFLGTLLMFMNPPGPKEMFGITAVVLVIGFVGAAAGGRSRLMGRRSAMADFRRSLGLKDR